MTWHSLIFIENLRNFDEITVPVWDILEEIFARHGRPDLVWTHYAANIGGLAGRRYIRGVHFVQEVEIVDDRGKLLAEGPGLLFVDSQANQKGNILYQFSIYGEGWCRLIGWHFVPFRKKRVERREWRAVTANCSLLSISL
jgi:hypothetical protein